MYDTQSLIFRKLRMDILLLLCFLVLVPNPKAADHQVHQHCPISRCSHDGPLIQFPFRLKGDPLHCGNPAFEVSCGRSNNTNVTMIQLSSSSGFFPIKKIDYNNRHFEIYDGDGCMARRLLNFTFSDSYSNSAQSPYLSSLLFYPVHYYYQYDPYSDSAQPPFPDSSQFCEGFVLLNCSTTQNVSRWIDYYMPIRCLSDPAHYQVLAVGPLRSIDELAALQESTCTILEKESYLPLRRVKGNAQGCTLKWESWVRFPECQNCNGRCDMDYRSNRMACHPHDQGHRSIIIAVSIASFVLISAMVVVGIFYYVKKSDRTMEREIQIKIEMFLDDHKSHVTRYSYADIKKMTSGFKKKLGEGGFGSVFSGKLLNNGVPVAIKVLKDSKGNGDDFVNEVGTIGRIHHVNVVRLLGFSAEEGKRALIYEDMPNSSLEKFITSKDQSRDNNASFDWMKLHNIITGIAKGIEYLHQGCECATRGSSTLISSLIISC